MKKKSIIAVLTLLIVMPCIMLLGACGKEDPHTITKENQTSTLTISDVYQDAFGNVTIDLENAEDYLDVQIVDGVTTYVSTIEISCDNGTNWADYFFYDTEDQNVGRILSFFEEDNDFKYSNGAITTSFSAGDELSIIARLKETDNYYASSSTAIYNYTLKSAVSDIAIGLDRISTEAELTGTLQREATVIINGQEIHIDSTFEYINNNDQVAIVDYVLYLYDNSVLKIGTVVVDGDTYTITPITNYGIFEYRFGQNGLDYTTLMDEYNRYNYDSNGWITAPSTGISFGLSDTYEEFGSNFLNVIIRQKETSTTCYSTCDAMQMEIATED